MSRYLTNMADVLRAAGLNVVEERGLSKTSGQMIPWQGFGRSSNSQYGNGRPTAVMNHHTVSNTAPANDVNYCNVVSDIRPLTNLIAVRDGTIHVCAGGPTNTNGSGQDTWGGGVPDNDMNRHAIGIEISNLGNGSDPYPEAQQNAVLTANIALCKAYGIKANNCRAHFEWAPGRKVDPRGPSRWAPDGGMWNMDQFRADVQAGLVSPTPPPSTGDDSMVFVAKTNDTGVVHFIEGVLRWGQCDNAQMKLNMHARAGSPCRDLVTGLEVLEESQITEVNPETIRTMGANVASLT